MRDALTTSATAIADRAGAQHQAGDAGQLSLQDAFAAVAAHADTARATIHPDQLTIFERDLVKIGRLVDLLLQGGFRDQCAQAAGLTSRSVRYWMERAKDTDPRYAAVADLILIAEAVGEQRHIANIVKHSGKEWTASAWMLERKNPDRWGRRVEADTEKGVTVIIGVKDSDVQVNINAATGPVGALGELEKKS